MAFWGRSPPFLGVLKSHSFPFRTQGIDWDVMTKLRSANLVLRHENRSRIAGPAQMESQGFLRRGAPGAERHAGGVRRRLHHAIASREIAPQASAHLARGTPSVQVIIAEPDC